jgi:predicted amidophosphoribosyltransferase
VRAALGHIEENWLAELDPLARRSAETVVDLDQDRLTCPACLTEFAKGPRACPSCGLRLY